MYYVHGITYNLAPVDLGPFESMDEVFDAIDENDLIEYQIDYED